MTIIKPRVRVPVLDEGYLELVEYYGSEESIIEAARMSTDGAFRGWGPLHDFVCPRTRALDAVPFHVGPEYEEAMAVPCECTPKRGDEALLEFLYRNKHSTPFEMAGLIFEVQAPIMVFREWHRHRTQSYNELSARYTQLPPLYYMPTVERVMINVGKTSNNKQVGVIQGAEVLTEEATRLFLDELADTYQICEERYERALKNGIPKELARLHIPVGHYSRMRAAGNLRNWLAFLTLRTAENAQYEIRVFADEVAKAIQKVFPRVYDLYVESK